MTNKINKPENPYYSNTDTRTALDGRRMEKGVTKRV
jgi:hypothetical protein